MPYSKHSRLNFERYLAIHARCIETANTYFIERSNLVAPDIVSPGELRIHGDLLCKGGLVIQGTVCRSSVATDLSL